MGNPCKICFGRGSIQVQEADVEDEIEMVQLTEKPCPRCGGSGEEKLSEKEDGDYDI